MVGTGRVRGACMGVQRVCAGCTRGVHVIRTGRARGAHGAHTGRARDVQGVRAGWAAATPHPRRHPPTLAHRRAWARMRRWRGGRRLVDGEWWHIPPPPYAGPPAPAGLPASCEGWGVSKLTFNVTNLAQRIPGAAHMSPGIGPGSRCDFRPRNRACPPAAASCD